MPEHLTKNRKIVVTGSRSVGKTAVTIQFTESRFVENYDPTIENTFKKKINHRGTTYLTDIVDTAGQDQFSIFQPRYAVGVDGYILVYNVANRSSFDMIRILNDKILTETGSDQVPRIIVGNKTDLGPKQRKVETAEAQQLARDLGCDFIESSAKNNEHVTEIFSVLLDRIEGFMVPQVKESNNACIIA
ncbi:Ras-like protein RHEB [Acrasis kona]|uniref:Ras-like protein RHEB n=1 Tax=Acrasis kona TaxID=1008807 RepID=A0AAW2ZI45_9EUKA